MNRIPRQRFQKAYTMIELLIAVLIFGLLMAAVSHFYYSVSRQGVKQDRETATWYTYSGAIEALRDDLGQAIALNVGKTKIEMTTIRIGENMKLFTSNISWTQEGKTTLSRFADGKRTTFEFAGSFPPQDTLSICFSLLP